ncbi:MAG: hypothetical protein IPL01_09940 [Acidobacteria bacterium]|nr:hypothetical protein [Acidobacteriota bacterium]
MAAWQASKLVTMVAMTSSFEQGGFQKEKQVRLKYGFRIDNGTGEISMEFRLQADMLGNKVFRLKAELHTYFVCSVISNQLFF